MKRVYTIKDIEQLVATGGTLPANAILTPQAKEAMASAEISKSTQTTSKNAGVVGAKEYKVPEKEYKWEILGKKN